MRADFTAPSLAPAFEAIFSARRRASAEAVSISPIFTSSSFV